MPNSIPTQQQPTETQSPAPSMIPPSAQTDPGDSMDLFSQAAREQEAQQQAAPPQESVGSQDTGQPSSLPGASQDLSGQPSPSTEPVQHPAATESFHAQPPQGQDSTGAQQHQQDLGQVPAQASGMSPDTLARLQALGIDPSQQGVDPLGSLLERVNQLTPYAQAGFQALNQQQAAQPQQQQPAEPEQPGEPEWDPQQYFAEKWQVPEFKAEYEHAVNSGIVQLDDQTGMYVAAPGREMLAAPVLQGLNEYHQRRAAQMQDLFSGNPFERFHQALSEPIRRDMRSEVEKLIDERLGKIDERAAQEEDKRFFESFREQNASWMYSRDAAGNEIETPQGKRLIDSVESLIRDHGMSPRKATELAHSLMTGATNTQPPTGSGAAPAGSPTHASGAAQPSAPQQNAATPNPHPQQPAMTSEQVSAQQQQSFLDSALNRAAHNASAVGGVPAQAPEDVGDLDSIFTIAAAAQAGQHTNAS